jgi:hypothetical protein
MSEKIESFRDLNVYRLAFELQQEIFILTKKFPELEKCRKIGKMLGKMMASPSSSGGKIFKGFLRANPQ